MINGNFDILAKPKAVVHSSFDLIPFHTHISSLEGSTKLKFVPFYPSWPYFAVNTLAKNHGLYVVHSHNSSLKARSYKAEVLPLLGFTFPFLPKLFVVENHGLPGYYFSNTFFRTPKKNPGL